MSQLHVQSLAEPSAAKQPPFEQLPPLSSQSRLPLATSEHAETAYHVAPTPDSVAPSSFTSVVSAIITAVSPESSSEHAPLAPSHVKFLIDVTGVALSAVDAIVWSTLPSTVRVITIASPGESASSWNVEKTIRKPVAAAVSAVAFSAQTQLALRGSAADDALLAIALPDEIVQGLSARHFGESHASPAHPAAHTHAPVAASHAVAPADDMQSASLVHAADASATYDATKPERRPLLSLVKRSDAAPSATGTVTTSASRCPVSLAEHAVRYS